MSPFSIFQISFYQIQENSKDWFILQYAEHLAAPVPKPAVSLLLKVIAQPIQVCLFTVLKLGLWVPLKD